ncbi:hypothetical protein EDD27_3479 [Nonomuraea polychroma]|uniref:Uncharacterized protein n=1 Tax=Nonomuraea polychroma TaxID=46176 RepID=A0A438M599_9ACTN|nr:hypothetical protein EDD27_3479 [Nonomuraea polychroma]
MTRSVADELAVLELPVKRGTRTLTLVRGTGVTFFAPATLHTLG